MLPSNLLEPGNDSFCGSARVKAPMKPPGGIAPKWLP
jgi:hypothetical protein